MKWVLISVLNWPSSGLIRETHLYTYILDDKGRESRLSQDAKYHAVTDSIDEMIANLIEFAPPDVRKKWRRVDG